MQRMARRESSSIWWLINQHGVHSSDVGSSKTLDIVQHLRFKNINKLLYNFVASSTYARMKAVLEQYFVINEILGFVIKALTTDVRHFGK